MKSPLDPWNHALWSRHPRSDWAWPDWSAFGAPTDETPRAFLIRFLQAISQELAGPVEIASPRIGAAEALASLAHADPSLAYSCATQASRAARQDSRKGAARLRFDDCLFGEQATPLGIHPFCYPHIDMGNPSGFAQRLERHFAARNIAAWGERAERLAQLQRQRARACALNASRLLETPSIEAVLSGAPPLECSWSRSRVPPSMPMRFARQCCAACLSWVSPDARAAALLALATGCARHHGALCHEELPEDIKPFTDEERQRYWEGFDPRQYSGKEALSSLTPPPRIPAPPLPEPRPILRALARLRIRAAECLPTPRARASRFADQPDDGAKTTTGTRLRRLLSSARPNAFLHARQQGREFSFAPAATDFPETLRIPELAFTLPAATQPWRGASPFAPFADLPSSKAGMGLHPKAAAAYLRAFHPNDDCLSRDFESLDSDAMARCAFLLGGLSDETLPDSHLPALFRSMGRRAGNDPARQALSLNEFLGLGPAFRLQAAAGKHFEAGLLEAGLASTASNQNDAHSKARRL